MLNLPQNQLIPMRRSPPPCRVHSEPDLFGFSLEAVQAAVPPPIQSPCAAPPLQGAVRA